MPGAYYLMGNKEMCIPPDYPITIIWDGEDITFRWISVGVYEVLGPCGVCIRMPLESAQRLLREMTDLLVGA
jgi:hypothetical protein